MRTSKRWTNVTFTRRVDRAAGRRRADAALAGRPVCAGCGAVNLKRRWVRGTLATQNAHGPAGNGHTLCPACRLEHEGRFAGEVRVTGTFLSGHRAEIEQLVRNEARRAADDNPLARIVRLDRLKNGLRVRTSTEHLAQRIGHALHKAMRGNVVYRFSHENKFAHVLWSRD